MTTAGQTQQDGPLIAQMFLYSNWEPNQFLLSVNGLLVFPAHKAGFLPITKEFSVECGIIPQGTVEVLGLSEV